ncbi:MAG: late competence development ComFB family protein [Treponema sp.]|nr:late competence development ComFB family protein [Treponema sp.]
MELHNTNEDIVIAHVNDMFNAFDMSGKHDDICTCEQCRMDTVCYVLNRIEPRYIVSNRGVVRIEQNTIENQQKEADIVAMIHEGISKINHNKRPSSNHQVKKEATPLHTGQMFNIPTITGRIFDGMNFAPMTNIDIELLCDKEKVTMLNTNWQNPFHLVEPSQGVFSFWPSPIPAKAADEYKFFEFSIRVNEPGFDELKYFFKIPVKSEQKNITTFSPARTFKLPDLYLFPPGEETF